MIDYELVEKYLDVARSAVNTEGLCNLEDITNHLQAYQTIFGMNDNSLDELIRRVLEHVSIS